MTGNASGQVGSPVTCYGCEHNANRAWSRASGKWLGDLHCTHCHEDGHRACVVCGSCLAKPDRYGRVFQKRWDKFYCSSTCRVKGLRERERAALERAAWEAEHPEQAAKERAEYEAKVAELRVLAETAGEPERADDATRENDTQGRADRCAHVEHVKVGERPFPGMADEIMRFVMPVYKSVPCEVRFSPTDVIYRRHERGLRSKILPYCEGHACGMPSGYHNRDLEDTGRYHPNCSCPGDEHGQHKWTKAEPCAYCGRLVRNHNEAVPHRFVRDWMTRSEAEYRRKALAGLSGDEYREAARQLPWGPREPRTFCSKRCKRAVSRSEAKANQLARRGTRDLTCAVCKAEVKSRRSDARYCSNACRQRSYRERHKTDVPT